MAFECCNPRTLHALLPNQSKLWRYKWQAFTLGGLLPSCFGGFHVLRLKSRLVIEVLVLVACISVTGCNSIPTIPRYTSQISSRSLLHDETAIYVPCVSIPRPSRCGMTRSEGKTSESILMPNEVYSLVAAHEHSLAGRFHRTSASICAHATFFHPWSNMILR